MTEDYEEVVLIADTGTVFVRGGYERKSVWLGLSKTRDDQDPEPLVMVELTPRQRRELCDALTEVASTAEDDHDEP